MSNNKSRRSFFKTATAGSAFLAAAPSARAQRKPFKRNSPSSTDLIEVGVITCGEYTHIDFGWGLTMNPPPESFKGGYWPRMTGMIMTYCWDPDPVVAGNFARQNDIKVARNYYDMVDKVDAVICSGFYATGWWPQLTKPYLEAGIPCLINRPFAFSMKEAREMIARSKKHNALIYVPSAYESRYETERMFNNVLAKIEEGAHIRGAYCRIAGNEYPAHGVHGLYNIYTALKPKVVAASLQAKSWWDFGTGFMTMKCVQDNGPEYYIGLHVVGVPGDYSNLLVFTSKGRLEEHIEFVGGENRIYNQLKNHNATNMFAFNKMLVSGEMPQTHDFILDKTRTFLTGFYSHCEKDGLMINCDDLPEDWRAPEVQPDHISDEIFK